MMFRIGILAGAILVLGLAGSPLTAAADDRHEVIISLGKPDNEAQLLIVPDPLIIGRDRPGAAAWRLDDAARQIAQGFEVQFDSGSPFAGESATAASDTVISLGPLRQPLELGSYRYSVRLLGGGEGPVGERRGTVEIRDTSGISPKAYLFAGAIGVVLLLANYLDRNPLTRSYEHNEI